VSASVSLVSTLPVALLPAVPLEMPPASRALPVSFAAMGASTVPATATLSVVLLVTLPSDAVTVKLSPVAALVALMATPLGTRTKAPVALLTWSVP
jgi:hypothetical protein